MPKILQIALPTPLRRLFDYLAPERCESQTISNMVPGIRISVPFGNQVLVGILICTREHSAVPEHKLRHALSILDKDPVITPDIMSLCQWASDYYHHPIGDTLCSALPTQLRKNTALPTKQYWVHTTEGKGLPADGLKRSPKQQKLHQLLLEHKTLSSEQLKYYDVTRATAVALRSKNLVEVRDCQSQPEHTSVHLHTTKSIHSETPKTLNEEQQAAVDSIRYHHYHTYLLDGTTGSGKTEVYLHAIARVLQAGRQALVLVPEIGLTPQTLTRFKKRFNVSIVELHSNVSQARRTKSWLAAARGEARIIIGTRLAIFTPIPDLGVIIIDEEHDLSFKQQDGLRYSARDVAVMRAYRSQIPLIVGSATPSLESLYNASSETSSKQYRHLHLTQRAGNAKPPTLVLCDMRTEKNHAGIAESSLSAIQETLNRKEQVLVFINRRGFAPALLCPHCGWTASCSFCDAKLTVHSKPKSLCCHYCNRQHSIPNKCPDCFSPQLQTLGQGTERCEETLKYQFPNTEIIRVDQDSMRPINAMQELHTRLQSGEPCILVGTQMLAKGHHFPLVTLAIILDIDQGLFSGDFRGLERTAQQIVQVSGRSGRSQHTGKVILQSYKPDHPMLQLLLTRGYHAFATELLKSRFAAHLPPVAHMAILRAESKSPERAVEFLTISLEKARQIFPASTHHLYLGPIPALMERRNEQYRYQLQMKCTKRSDLQILLTQLIPHLDGCALGRKVQWSIDVDPQDIS